MLLCKFETAIAEGAEFERLLEIRHENRKRFDTRPALRNEDPVECIGVERVGGDPVQRVRGNPHEFAIGHGRKR